MPQYDENSIDRCDGPWSNGGGCNPNPCDPGYRPPCPGEEPSCTALLAFGQWLRDLECRAEQRGATRAAESILLEIGLARGRDNHVWVKDAIDWIENTTGDGDYITSKARILEQLRSVETKLFLPI